METLMKEISKLLDEKNLSISCLEFDVKRLKDEVECLRKEKEKLEKGFQALLDKYERTAEEPKVVEVV